MAKSPDLLPFYQNKYTEAGCDEAGRGALAGPVFAAAVILPSDFFHPLLNDSKQLSLKEREFLKNIIEKEAVYYAVASCDEKKIDEINILRASILAMHLAVGKLPEKPGFLIVDGNRFTSCNDIPHKCIIKGDSKYASIAAASVLAKTYRDEFMRNLAKEYPQYGWEKNMAYPTKTHREAIAKYGPSPYHRLTYKLLPDPVLF
jgi:ribonuclease HII